MPKTEKTKKSKKEKTIHPNSRKAAQINRQNVKEDKRKNLKDCRDEKEKHLWQKIVWFQENLVDDKDRYTVAEVSDLIGKYIARFELRLDEITKTNELGKHLGRHGSAHIAEEAAIKMVVEKESHLFTAGRFEAPDLTNRKNVKVLREEGLQVKDLTRIKMRNFKQLNTTAEMELDEEELSEEE